MPTLLKTLKTKEIETLDWILLTHIHQDHAGGLGDLLKIYPDAKIVVHQSGAKHLVNPDRLWDGSIQVLGEVALVYDRILPVPEANVIVLDEVPFDDGIRVIPTPGHASHHQCFGFKDWFFAGELFGAHIPMDDALYLRPATPHRFMPEDYLSSLDAVESKMKNTVCFAHYSSATSPDKILSTAKDQLKLWVKIVDEHMGTDDMDEILNALLESDKVFELYNRLDPQIQARERTFAINSIVGMKKYLENK